MHHLPEHINQDIKGGKIKIWTQQQIKQNIGAKEIQQVNHKFSLSLTDLLFPDSFGL